MAHCDECGAPIDPHEPGTHRIAVGGLVYFCDGCYFETEPGQALFSSLWKFRD